MLHNKKKALSSLLLVAIALVSGCTSSDKTYEYYVLHPKKLEVAMNECQMDSPDASFATPHCRTVAQAAFAVRTLVVELANNEQLFGSKLLHLQMQLADLKNAPQDKQNQKEIAKLQLEIKMRLAVLRLLTMP